MPEATSLGAPSQRLEPAVIFLGFAALGLAGMAPSVTFGDAGEFAASAATLALPHAPSYPLYVLLARALGSVLELGNWAYRTNVLSVACGAAALSVLAQALRLAGMGLAGRLAAVLFLGLSPLWRRETALTEVFALNSLALAVLLWLACRFSGRLWGDRPMAALGLLLGLGLGNHHTLVLAVPALALEAWLERPPGARRLLRGLALAAGFSALGFLVYAYLPLRSFSEPPLDWGRPTTLERFLRVLLRKDYGSFSLSVEGPGSESLVRALYSQAARYLAYTAHGLGWPVLLLALLGAGLWRRGLPAPGVAGAGVPPPPSAGSGLPAPGVHGAALVSHGPSRWLALVLAVMAGPFFLCLGNPPFDAQTSGALERFFLASWLGLVWLAGAGLERFLSLDLAQPVLRRAIAAGLALWPLSLSWEARAQWWLRRDLAAYDYGRSVLKSLPPGAALFMDGGDDTFYTLAFLSYAQGFRPDLELHDRGGLVFKSAYGPDFRRLPKDLKEARRVEVEAKIAASGRLYYSTLRESIIPGYELRPWGLLRKTELAAGLPLGKGGGLWDIYPERASDSLLRRHYRDRALLVLYPFMRAAHLRARGEAAMALERLRLAWDMGADVLWLPSNLAFALGMIGYEASKASRWPLAEKAFLLALEAAPREAEPFLNLGVVYEKTGRGAQAEEAYRESLRWDPRSSRAYYNLGALYWSGARWSESSAAFEKALELKPGDPVIGRFLAEARQRAHARAIGRASPASEIRRRAARP